MKRWVIIFEEVQSYTPNSANIPQAFPVVLALPSELSPPCNMIKLDRTELIMIKLDSRTPNARTIREALFERRSHRSQSLGPPLLGFCLAYQISMHRFLYRFGRHFAEQHAVFSLVIVASCSRTNKPSLCFFSLAHCRGNAVRT